MVQSMTVTVITKKGKEKRQKNRSSLKKKKREHALPFTVVTGCG
jgi:hypothetical protein